jgi:outer membrane lipoprotein-sorting protein
MKHFLLTLIIAALVATSTAAPVAPNGNLDQILAKMQAAAKNIATLRASLEQRKRLVQIGGSENYKGNLIFKHAGRNDWVRINYSNGQQVSVDPKEIVLYQPRIKQAIITTRGKLASENQEFAFFSAPYSLTTAQMKQRYDIVHVGDENVGGTNTSVLQLTPKGQSAVKQMKWWVSQSSWLPVKSEMIDAKSGDVTTFTLANMEMNPKISDGDFKINLPSGTKVIRK